MLWEKKITAQSTAYGFLVQYTGRPNPAVKK